MVTMSVIGALILLSATLNFMYWYGQAPTPNLAYLMGGTSFLVDLIKPMTPFFLAGAIRNNRPPAILTALLLLLTCVCFSMASAVGLSSIARFDGGTMREGKAASYTNLQQERRRIMTAINSSTTTQEPSEIDAEMAAILAQPIKRGRKSYGTVGERSNHCQKPERRSRDGCARYAQLAIKKATATARQGNISRLREIDQELNTLRSTGLVASADPQANVFAAMLGIENVDAVRNVLVLLFAWTLEFSCLVAPVFIWRNENDPSSPTMPSTPEPEAAPSFAVPQVRQLRPIEAPATPTN